jgi:predicted cobalt transporter CbtA
MPDGVDESAESTDETPQSHAYRAECTEDDCGWSFEDSWERMVETAAENHENLYLELDHETTDVKRVVLDE